MMEDQVLAVEGTITLADGTTSKFAIHSNGGASQWGADRERLGRTVDVLESMVDAIAVEYLMDFDGE